MLKEFLSRTLKKKVELVEFLRNELPVVSTTDKVKTVDVLVKVGGEYIHIEINANDQPYLHPRNFIYFTNMYSRKVVRGEEYDYKTKFLLIDLTYGMKEMEDDFCYYYIMNDKGKKYIDNFEIIEFNMDKIMKYWYTLDKEKVNKYKHLIMLDLETNELNELSKGDDFVEEYENKIIDLNNQETFQSFMSYEEDQKLIQNTEKNMAYESGVSIGISQGEKIVRYK